MQSFWHSSLGGFCCTTDLQDSLEENWISAMKSKDVDVLMLVMVMMMMMMMMMINNRGSPFTHGSTTPDLQSQQLRHQYENHQQQHYEQKPQPRPNPHHQHPSQQAFHKSSPRRIGILHTSILSSQLYLQQQLIVQLIYATIKVSWTPRDSWHDPLWSLCFSLYLHQVLWGQSHTRSWVHVAQVVRLVKGTCGFLQKSADVNHFYLPHVSTTNAYICISEWHESNFFMA